MDRGSTRFVKDRRTLEAMLEIYCREQHHHPESLCGECAELLAYAEDRLENCPFGESKPKCAKCTVHCYKPAMRERARLVMRFAGPRMLTQRRVPAMGQAVHGAGKNPHASRREPA